MKKIITLLTLVFCISAKAQDYQDLLTYNTIDDFFNKKGVNHGKVEKFVYQFHGAELFTCDSLGIKIKYSIKDHKIFAYEYDYKKCLINAASFGETFFCGNKQYFATCQIGTVDYDTTSSRFWFATEGKTGNSKVNYYYYRASEPTKKLTLEELLMDCPEVYKKYTAPKKEGGRQYGKRDLSNYFNEQIAFFKMYIDCKSKK